MPDIPPPRLDAMTNAAPGDRKRVLFLAQTPPPHHGQSAVAAFVRDVFETDAGRVGILICYDVEFPELGRLLADQDMDILFVPFWTDTKNGYLRVRHCAQARAIENECYVVLCGSVGNVPSIRNLDIQYAQSSVFTPSDFAFPHDAVLSETTPNTEMVIFSDLDLTRLTVVRAEGSVTNLKDRRKDLFDLRWRDWSWKSGSRQEES